MYPTDALPLPDAANPLCQWPRGSISAQALALAQAAAADGRPWAVVAPDARTLDQLQRALDNAGLSTGNAGLQFSLRDQSSQGQNDGGQSNPNAHRLVVSEEDSVPSVVASRGYAVLHLPREGAVAVPGVGDMFEKVARLHAPGELLGAQEGDVARTRMGPNEPEGATGQEQGATPGV